MNIKEMHESFRVLGQQQGMQLVRGILPESIDVYLNNVINSIVREEILANAKTVLQDNVNTQPTALGPTNVLRTLYRNYSIDLRLQYKYDDDGTPVNGVREDGTFDGLWPDDETAQFPTYNNNKFKTINTVTGYQEIWLPVRANTARYVDDFPPEQTDKFLDIMMYLGFSVDWYTNYGDGNETPYSQLTKKESTGIRMIGGDVLETTFRDYCNAAGKDAPVGVILTDNVDSDGYAK